MIFRIRTSLLFLNISYRIIPCDEQGKVVKLAAARHVEPSSDGSFDLTSNQNVEIK